MTSNHLRNVLEYYHSYLVLAGFSSKMKPESIEWPEDHKMALDNCVWMCDESIRFLDEDNFEKARGWLCFVQGCLWFCRIFTIEQMRHHSREPKAEHEPDSPVTGTTNSPLTRDQTEAPSSV